MADRYLTGFTKLAPKKPDTWTLQKDMMHEAEEMGLADYLKLHSTYNRKQISSDINDFIDEMVSPFSLESRFIHDHRDMFDEFRASEDDYPNDEMWNRINEAVLVYHVRAVIDRVLDDLTTEHKNEVAKGSGGKAVRDFTARLTAEVPRLSGPDTLHAVDEMIASLHAFAPWMRGLSAWIHSTMRASYADGRSWLSLPPVLLVGPPGLGKSTYARKLADLSGAPSRALDAASSGASFAVAGGDATWHSAQAGIPLQTIADTGTANPIIVVDEIDKCGHMRTSSGNSASLPNALLSLIEPSTNTRWECPYTRRAYDMSQINWILTANSIGSVPQPLIDRCRVFQIEQPGTQDIAQMISLQCKGRVFDEVRDEVIAMTARARGHVSLRQVQHVINEAAATMNKPILH